MDPADEQLLAALPPERRPAEGVPGEAIAAARERAARLVSDRLGTLVRPDGLRVSPLGAGWSSDLDVHVHAMPRRDELVRAGWLPLDGLLVRLGRRTQGRWAVVEAVTVLAALDLQVSAPPDPVETVLKRCARRNEVRLREVLELRALQRNGHPLPDGEPAIETAARLEAMLGGDELAAHLSATGPTAAARRVTRGRVARRLRPRGLRRLRFRRVVIALAGVDGAGKSTLTDRLVEQLGAAGVPARSVWCRPGMGTIERIAGTSKRLLGVGTEAGVRQVARGDAARPASRRGIFGWVWALVVTASYLFDVWRSHLRATGVVVYDRHLLDALATLSFVYGRSPEGLHARLLCWMLPRAERTFYLEIDAELAVSRKSDPLFGRYAVEQQLDRYRALLEKHGATRLDVRRPVDVLAYEVLRDLTVAGGRRNRYDA